MAFKFSIIDFASISDTDLVQNTTAGVEATIGSKVGDTHSFSTFSSVTAETADGDYPDDFGAKLTAPLTINGVTYPVGANIEANWEIITVDPKTGYYYRVTGLYVNNKPVGVSLSRAWDATIGAYVPGSAGVYVPDTVLTHIDGDDLDNTPNIKQFATDDLYSWYGIHSSGIGNDAKLTDSNGTVPCFTAGTMIRTDRGPVAVEDLCEGDRVMTLDRGFQPLRWIGARKLGPEELHQHPNLRPIRIRAGALGNGLPEQDLLVSPQHRILVCSAIAQHMFGEREVLVAAKQLVALEGIEVAEDVKDVEYWHFIFDRHELVWANGAPSESLFLGEEALKALAPEARAEIFAIFPKLQDEDTRARLTGARLLLNGRMGRKLAERHHMKNRSLLAA